MVNLQKKTKCCNTNVFILEKFKVELKWVFLFGRFRFCPLPDHANEVELRQHLI